MSALKKLMAAALISTVLSSCSFGPSLEKDESARAIFDVENDQVILPLDAYDTTGKDEYFTKALELARKKVFCRTRAALRDVCPHRGIRQELRQDLRNLER